VKQNKVCDLLKCFKTYLVDRGLISIVLHFANIVSETRSGHVNG